MSVNESAGAAGVRSLSGRVKAICSAIAAAGVMGLASAAHAALVFDQFNLAPTDQGPLAASGIQATNRQVQTVTAGVTGTLALVDLQVWGGLNFGDLRVSLYDGDYAGASASGPAGSPGGFGTFVGSVSRPISLLPTQAQTQTGALAVFDFSSFDYQVAPGQVFSLLLDVTDSLGTAADVFGYFSDPADPSATVGLSYNGGYNASTQFGTNFHATAADRGFATIVDVAHVPEPTSWALMIGGLGLAGAALRRRRDSIGSAA